MVGQSFPTETQYATAFNQGRHLALDPTTGWLHLVYQYKGDALSDVLYSYSTDQGLSWSPPEYVGTGMNPCIACEDDHVWVSYWREPDSIVLTALKVDPPPSPGKWLTFVACPDKAVAPPSMATRHDLLLGTPAVYVAYTLLACVWHQQDLNPPQDEDVWACLFKELWPRQIQQDDYMSVYPSVVAELTTIPELILSYVWTSATAPGSPSPYEVRFHRDFFWPLPPDGGFQDLAYYNAWVGDSVKSRYCRARDGFRRWRDFSVDFGRDSLKYRLCYLNPNYDYRVEAVLFQVGRDTWEQSFAFDGQQVKKVRFRPEVPEIVSVYVPRDKYARDGAVDLDIRRLVGDYAVLAEMKLFQYCSYRRTLDGLDAGLSGDNDGDVRILVTGVTLSKTGTAVHLEASAPRRVAIDVFDTGGRHVRSLASSALAYGTSAVSWNGLDDAGRRVPASAYLVRVADDGCNQARKVVLTQ